MASPTASSQPRSHAKAYVFAGLVTALVTFVMVLLIVDTLHSPGHPLTTFNPHGTESHRIESLAQKVFIVAGIVFVLVEGAVIFLVFRFRARDDDGEEYEEPIQKHGHSTLEWTWTAVPLVLLLFLGLFYNLPTIFKLDNDSKHAAMTVEVVGQQWWWEFRYDLNAKDEPDIITVGQMVIPVKTLISLHIRSNDVIHSFWIPALNGTKDAVPGRTQDLAIEADKPGIYEGQCKEYCGLSHGYMRMQVKALSASDYAAWKANQLKGPVEPKAGTMAADGQQLVFQQCTSCHQINGYGDKTVKGKVQFGKLSSNKPATDYMGANQPLISGNAPNLTHLMSRERFAGAMFPLYETYTKGHGPETVDPEGKPDQGQLVDWLHNPALKKPMDPDGKRGMPNLNLTDDQILKIVSYLTTLK
jgi:cytochrome c oxidase subunit 2